MKREESFNVDVAYIVCSVKSVNHNRFNVNEDIYQYHMATTHYLLVTVFTIHPSIARSFAYVV